MFAGGGPRRIAGRVGDLEGHICGGCVRFSASLPRGSRGAPAAGVAARREPLSTGHDPLLGDPAVRVPHTQLALALVLIKPYRIRW